MSCKITLIYPFKNRDVLRVKKSFASLEQQTNKNFQVFFIDYGSNSITSSQLKTLCAAKPYVKYYYVHTKNQPWNKSRAINIALKYIETDYIFIADVDMFFKNNFIEWLHKLKSLDVVTYFQVGFLSKVESAKNIDFTAYQLINKSDSGATGLTLFPTNKLKEIGGFDEFYHFWGSEDTDAHVRMENKGLKLHYFDNELLLLHQYHPSFQQIQSKQLTKKMLPSDIVRFNYTNQLFNLNNRITRVNNGREGVEYSEDEVMLLESKNDYSFTISNECSEVEYYIYEKLNGLKNGVVWLQFSESIKQKNNLKQTIKNIIKKESKKYYSLNEINTLLLKEVICKYRYNLYSYTVNEELSVLTLKLKL